VFADTLSLQALAYNILKGHLFTAFKSLGDAKGFIYYSLDKNNIPGCIMGDSIAFEKVKSLNAVAPLPGQFRLVHDGETVNISSGDEYQFSFDNIQDKGAYRIEVHIKLKGKYVPWIYSNPIYIY